MCVAWTVHLLWKSIEIKKSYIPAVFSLCFMICVSKLDCLQETETWMHNIWSCQRCECSVQALLLLWLLFRVLWPVSRTVSSGHLVPSATHPCRPPLRRLPLSSFSTSISPSRFGVKAVAAQDPSQHHLRCLHRGTRALRATILLQGPPPRPAGESEPPGSGLPLSLPVYHVEPPHRVICSWRDDVVTHAWGC